MQVQRSRSRQEAAPCDPQSIERGVRQMLADKVSGQLVGVWLLVAEHLRLGTWDLLQGWTRQPGEHVQPRLALQLVHEAALCTTGIRKDRTLSNRGGFELANGLPFVASDTAVHHLLSQRDVQDAVVLQVALGKIRRVNGDFLGKVLAIDPHRVRSYSQRHMRKHAKQSSSKPMKMAQTFWLTDADTRQPVCFSSGTSSRTVAQATPLLLETAAEILTPQEEAALVVADTEHCVAELMDCVMAWANFELLTPQPKHASLRKQLREIPPEEFTRRWAGFATTQRPYQMRRGQAGSCWQYVQRNGERPEDWTFQSFLSTTDRDEVDPLTLEFPKRWHIEEFFNFDQALGWQRAGTQNLNIRYGQMTLALIAQAALHRLRARLGPPIAEWDANHLAQQLLQGLDGDVRVTADTIVVTYYNAPNVEILRRHYEGLPERLMNEGIDPRVPWLYGFQLDFRFR